MPDVIGVTACNNCMWWLANMGIPFQAPVRRFVCSRQTESPFRALDKMAQRDRYPTNLLGDLGATWSRTASSSLKSGQWRGASSRVGWALMDLADSRASVGKGRLTNVDPMFTRHWDCGG